MTLLIVSALFVAALWDIGRRVTNTRGQYVSQDAFIALATKLDNQYVTMSAHNADFDALKSVTAAQGQTLARHTALLTKEALEKTQPLARIKR